GRSATSNGERRPIRRTGASCPACRARTTRRCRSRSFRLASRRRFFTSTRTPCAASTRTAPPTPPARSAGSHGPPAGHWEGDTFVVDVVHLNDETWLDHAGNFHSDQLHVIERYSLLDQDHLQYEATLEDPKVFTRPWSIKVTLYRRVEPGVQLLDYECYI